MSSNSCDSSSCSPAPNSTIIDSLLVDLFSFMQETCKNCHEKTPAAARCVECNFYLCNPCINIHNKKHEIIKLQDNASSSISIDSVSDSSEATTSPFNMRRMICDIHQEEPARVVCITCCYVSACSDCVINIHSTHDLSYINEENMMAVHMKLQEEARSSMAVVVRATDNVRMMSTKLHTKLQMRVADMKQTFQRYIAALEARSHELVAQMEYIHRIKVSRLVSQMERLQVVEARLRYVSNQLNAAYVSASNREFIMANERAHNELKSIRSLRTELTPCEDDNIQFVQSDRGFFSALRALGHVTGGPSNPPVVAPPPTPLIDITPSVSNPVQKCRPIYGASGDVVVKHPSDLAMVFSNDGVEDGELCRPWGVCCNSQGNIIVSDRSNNRIQVFDPNGKFLYKFGSQGNGMGQFERPTGVCVGPNNNIVVADKDNHRIQIFRMDGTFMFAFGEKGTNNGQFNYPWDVACNSLGAIAVSDTRNHRIQLFTSTGSFINKYGYESNNAMWKYFDSPRGVAFTPDGSLLVSDFNKHRIIIIDKNFVNARFLGGEGSRDKQFLRPQGIVCDDRGNIVVADSKNHRIQVFDSRGNFLFRVGRYGKNGVADFDRPSGICLSPCGRIIVVDFGNARMQVL